MSCGTVKGLAYEMRQNFRVRLGVELVSPLDELLAESLVIFYDAVVHKIQAPRAIGVRVGVFAGYGSMGGPAGMADSNRPGDRIFFDLGGQVGNTPHSFSHFDATRLKQGDASRIVSAVFQSMETIKQDGQGV
jgi:hypothetical protein